LGFCLSTESLSTSNFAYFFPTAGAEGLGVTLGNLTGNGRIAATKFRDSTFGTGITGNQLGTLSSSIYGAGQSGLIVGKITWGAANDTIEIYRPGADLVLPATPISTLTTTVNQAAFDTITWARGDKVVMDEIRFGASYAAVIETGSAWDLNGDIAGAGSATPSGTWDSESIWNLAPDGTLVPIPWQPGSVATFSAGGDATGAYNVTVDGTQDISGLLFEDGTVTVSGGTALRMTKNTTVNVAPTLTATTATPFTESTPGLQLAKAGSGTLVLSGNNVAATGGLTLSGGVTRFESPAAISGTTRNVALGSAGTLMFGSGFGAANIPTALLDRVTTNSAGAIAADNYASTDFDFGTAGLTATSLGAVGNVSYTGVLTPQGTTYRLGGGGGTITMANANAITGANALVVNGNTTLAQDNDYTGTTTINANSTLTIEGTSTTSGVTLNTPNTTLVLGNDSSLGTGTLTVANSFAGPGTVVALGTITVPNALQANPDVIFGGSGTFTVTGTTTLANNVVITNNNTTNPTTLGAITAAGGVRTLTFSGNGNTTLAGAIGGGTNVSNLTKNGNGTLTLQGVNTHTGTTAVNNGGTLAIISPGSLPAGAVTLNNTSTLAGTGTVGGSVTVTATAGIAPGIAGVGTLPITGTLTVSAMAGSTGTLKYDLGPVAASDKITVGGTLVIGAAAGPGLLGMNDFVFTNAGGLTAGTYKLITGASAITGILDPANLTGPVGSFDGALQITGTDIELVLTGGATPYLTWSGGPGADVDTNGDGVDNGVAWALGAADPNVNAIGLLPTLDNTSDPTYLIFEFDRSDTAFADPNTAITVEYGSTLAGWTTAVDDDDNVDIIVTPGTPSDTVQVKLKRSSLAAAGKLFARLKVLVTP
jgi:autotransporter-associated beta strand protein